MRLSGGTVHGTPGDGGVPFEIEALVRWAYETQAVLSSGGTIFSPSGRPVTPTAQAMHAAALGTVVSGGGLRRNSCPDLALLIDQAVDIVGGRSAVLIRRHGRAGTRPDWGADMRTHFEPTWKLEPRFLSSGAPDPAAIKVARHFDLNRNLKAAWCPVELVDPPELIEARRLEYVLWWHGLDALASGLASSPACPVAVRPPAAPLQPWLAGGKNPIASYDKI